MTGRLADDDAIGRIGVLAEPNRRRLYEMVAASGEPVSRDEAATALGISRELAAFHLDRLLAAGLLQSGFGRQGGRTGPGAGRPAKLYRRGDSVVSVSLPPRNYDLAAALMATALDRLGGTSGAEAVAVASRERGVDVGVEARRRIGSRLGRRRLFAALVDILRGAGYDPQVEAADGRLSLRNCPFEDLALSHRALTCGLNLAWAEGVVDGLHSPARAELAPEPGRCCVVFHTAPSVASERLKT